MCAPVAMWRIYEHVLTNPGCSMIPQAALPGGYFFLLLAIHFCCLSGNLTQRSRPIELKLGKADLRCLGYKTLLQNVKIKLCSFLFSFSWKNLGCKRWPKFKPCTVTLSLKDVKKLLVNVCSHSAKDWVFFSLPQFVVFLLAKNSSKIAQHLSFEQALKQKTWTKYQWMNPNICKGAALLP